MYQQEKIQQLDDRLDNAALHEKSIEMQAPDNKEFSTSGSDQLLGTLKYDASTETLEMANILDKHIQELEQKSEERVQEQTNSKEIEKIQQLNDQDRLDKDNTETEKNTYTRKNENEKNTGNQSNKKKFEVNPSNEKDYNSTRENKSGGYTGLFNTELARETAEKAGGNLMTGALKHARIK